MFSNVGQEILVQLLKKLQEELVTGRPADAISTLDLIEKVAGRDYRVSLMRKQLDTAIERVTEKWTCGVDVYA